MYPDVFEFTEKAAQRVFGGEAPCLIIFYGYDEKSDAAR